MLGAGWVAVFYCLVIIALYVIRALIACYYACPSTQACLVIITPLVVACDYMWNNMVTRYESMGFPSFYYSTIGLAGGLDRIC